MTSPWILLAGACFLYAGIDYVGYNSTRTSPRALRVYRVCQLGMQIGFTLLLLQYAGWASALGFNIIWWSFGLDFLYYVFSETVNAPRPWDRRGDFARGIMADACGWAYWTPIGIAHGMKRGRSIPARVLIVQAALGLMSACALMLAF